MNVIVVDTDQIEDLRKYAEDHPFTFEDFKNIYHKKAKSVGDRKEYYIMMSDCKLVYSIEWCCDATQTEKYMCRRMSVSLGFLPLETIDYIASLLGFNSENIQVRVFDKDPIPNIDITEILKSEKMLDHEKFSL